jgi:hypothetical protein
MSQEKYYYVLSNFYNPNQRWDGGSQAWIDSRIIIPDVLPDKEEHWPQILKEAESNQRLNEEYKNDGKKSEEPIDPNLIWEEMVRKAGPRFRHPNEISDFWAVRSALAYLPLNWFGEFPTIKDKIAALFLLISHDWTRRSGRIGGYQKKRQKKAVRKIEISSFRVDLPHKLFHEIQDFPCTLQVMWAVGKWNEAAELFQMGGSYALGVEVVVD